MKNIFLFLVLSTLVGCSKSSKNPQPSTSSLLVGTWIKGTETDTIWSISSSGPPYISSGLVTPKEYYQFNTDGSGLGGFYQSTIEEKFSYSLVNSKLYFLNTTSLGIGSSVFSYSPPQTYSVLQLSATQLVLFHKDTVTDSNGTAIYSYSLVCTKQ